MGIGASSPRPPGLPAPSLGLTIVITALFGLFGLIPAAIDAGKARDRGYPTGRYWGAFIITQIVTALAVVLIAVVFYGSLLAAFVGLSRNQDQYGAGTAPATYSTSGSTTAGNNDESDGDGASTTKTGSTETTPTETIPIEDPQESTRSRLSELADEGAASLDTDGHWVIQLASKWPGTTDPLGTTASGSHKFDAADVLAEHQALRSRFGDDVILIRSTDMGKQLSYPKMPAGEALWVTLYDPGTFASKSSAQKWCVTAFSGLSARERENSCYGRQATYPHS